MPTDNEDSTETFWEPPETPSSQTAHFAEGKPEQTTNGSMRVERKDK